MMGVLRRARIEARGLHEMKADAISDARFLPFPAIQIL